MLLSVLIWFGTTFQCWAAIYLKPLSLKVLFLLNGTSRYNVVDDVSHVFQVLFLILSLFLRYAGPILCRVSYTILRSLK